MLILVFVTLAIAVLTLGLVVFLLVSSRPADWIAAAERASERGERSVREEFARNRDESSLAARQVHLEAFRPGLSRCYGLAAWRASSILPTC